MRVDCLPNRYENSIYEVLSDESIIPGKVARRLDVTAGLLGDVFIALGIDGGCMLQSFRYTYSGGGVNDCI